MAATMTFPAASRRNCRPDFERVRRIRKKESSVEKLHVGPLVATKKLFKKTACLSVIGLLLFAFCPDSEIVPVIRKE
jgi:hypothetical protein